MGKEEPLAENVERKRFIGLIFISFLRMSIETRGDTWWRHNVFKELTGLLRSSLLPLRFVVKIRFIVVSSINHKNQGDLIN